MDSLCRAAGAHTTVTTLIMLEEAPLLIMSSKTFTRVPPAARMTSSEAIPTWSPQKPPQLMVAMVAMHVLSYEATITCFLQTQRKRFPRRP